MLKSLGLFFEYFKGIERYSSQVSEEANTSSIGITSETHRKINHNDSNHQIPFHKIFNNSDQNSCNFNFFIIATSISSGCGSCIGTSRFLSVLFWAFFHILLSFLGRIIHLNVYIINVLFFGIIGFFSF